MSGNDYNYDDQGQFFPFFVLTIAGLITGPLTYNVLKPSTNLEFTAPRIKSDFKPKDDEIIQAQKRRQIRKERKVKRMLGAAFGYAVMAYMIYLIIVTQRTIPKLWDPYAILGVSRSADEKAIDKFYKRLSLKYHPDKARPDPSNNVTVEFINDRWVEMTKAYKALTDEEIRNNYLQYGHPDGKQSFSIGIALPKLIVTQGNGKYVLLFYAVLLGVILPYTVGKWWYGTQALTKDQVLVASAGNLFREYKEDMSEGDVITALSIGTEFQEILKGPRADAGSAKVEKTVLAEAVLSETDRSKLKDIDDPVRRKTLSLLWAHLNRLDLGDTTLNEEKYEVAPVAFRLNNSLCSISLAFGHIGPLLSSLRTSQNLVQAMPSNASPLLQLPHFTPSLAEKLTGNRAKSSVTIQKFMDLPPQLRRSLCSDLSDVQYAEAMQVASQIPCLQVEKAFFKVVGDRVITPSSLVQFVIKARFIPLGTKDIPEVNSLDLEDIDPDEDDLDSLIGRKPARSRRKKTVDGQVIESDSNDNSVQPPLAHAPYFAEDHSPRWHAFLVEVKQGRVAVGPFTYTAFDKPIFDSEGKPTFNMQTLRCQFPAPPQVGTFPFVMHLVCDSYVGMDIRTDVVLEIKNVSEAVAVPSDDEISEPDEDSLAGQLQAMKRGGLTGGAPAKKKKVVKKPAQKKEKAKESSEDEESDTEGEVEDTSETDTETEPEGD